MPEDPIAAAKMRVMMNKFDKTIGGYFGVIVARYQDEEKITKFLDEVLPIYEKWCEDANGKYLLGTDDVTLVDVHCGGIWDSMFTGVQAEAHSKGAELLDLKTKAPNWWAYMERLRAHPELSKVCMQQACHDMFAARSMVYDVTKKCQLSLPELAAAFPECC